MTFLPKKVLGERIRRFLEEDIGQGDITTAVTIPAAAAVEAEIVVKDSGIAAGIEEARVFLESLGFQTSAPVADGSKIDEQTTILKIVGNARTLLSLERTLLNLLSRMMGIATKTNRVVNKVRQAGYRTRIACTRKVAPGLSYFDKKAVMLGGGDTHRLHLDDLVLVKENHLAIIGDVRKAVEKVRNTVSFSKKIEIEVSTTEEALSAVATSVDIVMLDNFSPQQIRETLALLGKKKLRDEVLAEASGGINEDNVLEFADTGVDILSLGEVTDSASALDMSLEVVRVWRE